MHLPTAGTARRRPPSTACRSGARSTDSSACRAAASALHPVDAVGLGDLRRRLAGELTLGLAGESCEMLERARPAAPAQAPPKPTPAARRASPRAARSAARTSSTERSREPDESGPQLALGVLVVLRPRLRMLDDQDSLRPRLPKPLDDARVPARVLGEPVPDVLPRTRSSAQLLGRHDRPVLVRVEAVVASRDADELVALAVVERFEDRRVVEPVAGASSPGRVRGARRGRRRAAVPSVAELDGLVEQDGQRLRERCSVSASRPISIPSPSSRLEKNAVSRPIAAGAAAEERAAVLELRDRLQFARAALDRAQVGSVVAGEVDDRHLVRRERRRASGRQRTESRSPVRSVRRRTRPDVTIGRAARETSDDRRHSERLSARGAPPAARGRCGRTSTLAEGQPRGAGGR